MPNSYSHEVASGVVNLGNTCYMNAVLQALAHAPELCLAIECESHRETCPIALKNRKERQNNNQRNTNGFDRDDEIARRMEPAVPTRATRSKVKGSRSSARQRNNNSPKNAPKSISDDEVEDDGFCILCEMEMHLKRVHFSSRSIDDGSDENALSSSNGNTSNMIPSSPGEAVAPSTFVNGFIKHVAPWFKLGVQEDSHEFLRLLIDAMQKSCIKARKKKGDVPKIKSEENGHANNDCGAKNAEQPNDNTRPQNASDSTDNSEYAFRLFRGTVESKVVCSNCGAVSSTIDPIEDIGLEVTPTSSGGSMHGSSSPTPGLVDVTTSMAKFTAMEKLDFGYKCESCKTIGRATKQSRFSTIPPILTLHLKRFRYGPDGKASGQQFPTSRRRSELSSLLGNNANGSSGSAKIEGHVKFDQIFNIHPYLTEEKQKECRSMFCRLFAVIVHSGKNSHSGHYIAYVRNVAKNEWWKMDDARVTKVSSNEVIAAEAYMLFYRVVDHPVAVELRKKEQAMKEEATKQAKRKAEELETVKVKKEDDVIIKTQNNTATTKENTENKAKGSKRKREEPKIKSGEEWARAKANANLPEALVQYLRRAEEYLSDTVDFKGEYFRLIMDEADAGGKVGDGPKIGVSPDEDVQGDVTVYKKALRDLLKKFLPDEGSELKTAFDGIENDASQKPVKKETKMETKPPTLIIPVVDPNETLI